MSSDNELLPQQASNKEKEVTHSWKAFLILLIVVHLPLAGLLINNLLLTLSAHRGLDSMLAGLIQSIFFPLLLFLVIMDYIAVRSYRKKQSSPWTVSVIFLVVINVIVFSFAGWIFRQPVVGEAAIAIWFIALCLLAFDFIMILAYISHLPDFKAKKVIFYTAITLSSIIIVLGLLLALSVFYYL